MSSFWQTEDGWPYADSIGETPDLDAETDEDLLSLRLAAGHALDTLSPLEREVVTSSFGLEGHRICTMQQLGEQLGLATVDLRDALGSGLAKLRVSLS